MKTTTVSKRFVALLCCIAVCIALIATALGVNLASRAQAEDAQEDGIELLEEEPSGDIQLIEEGTEAVPEDNIGGEAYQGDETAVAEETQTPAEEPASGEPDDTPIPEDSTEPESPTVPDDAAEPDSPAESEGAPEESGEPEDAEPAGSEEPAEADLAGAEATGETVDAAEPEPDDIDADAAETDSDDIDVVDEEPEPENADTDEEGISDEDDYGIMLLADSVASGTCGNDLTWELDDEGVLTISGTGAMSNWSSTSSPWYSHRSSIKSVIIEDGVTSIGNYAFQNCSALTDISIPEGVISIGEFAFEYCTSLESVELPNTLTSIDRDAFRYCSALTSISIPDGITSIDYGVFEYCTSLKNVELPSTLTSIGDYAFNGCSALTGISIPEGVTSIGTYAFNHCSLESIELPSALTSIGNYAFWYCPLNGDSMNKTTTVNAGAVAYSIIDGQANPTTVQTEYTGHTLVIPENVTSVGRNAFEYTSVDIFVIGNKLTSVTGSAFGSSSLDAIIFDNFQNKVNIDSYTNIARRSGSVVSLVYLRGESPIEVSVSKEWNDQDNHDGLRPASIDVQLTADGVVIDNQTLSEDNGWSYIWDGLDIYADGDEIVYEVIEPETPAGYTQSDTGMVKDNDGNYSITITNTHTPETIDIPVTKVWDDAENADGIRPESITVRLLADGVEVDDAVILIDTHSDPVLWPLSDNNDDVSYTFEGWPKYRDGGVEIVYTVIEDVVDDYTTEITGDAENGFVITNSHTPETIDISGTKVWDDADNQDGMRPERITVRLLADGVEVDSATVTSDSEGGWSFSFEGFNKYRNGGIEIVYTVTEDAIDGYATEIDEDAESGFVITNTHETEKIDFTVSKDWNDNDDQDGIRPEEIVVVLLADGDPTDDTLTLNESNGWSGSFTGLPMFRDQGTEIDYSIAEVTVDGYASQIFSRVGGHFIINNTHTPETIDISGSKVWDDTDDADGIRPESITVRLFADGVEVDSVEVSPDSEGAWSWSFTELPKYRDGGIEIVYTVTEDEVDGYDTEISGDAESGFVITNSHAPVRDLTIQKDVAGTGDTSTYDFEIALTQDGVDFEGELTLSNGETLTFSEGKAILSVAAGDAVTILSIPYGLDCSVTELTLGADSVVVRDANGGVIASAEGTEAIAELGAIQENTEVTFTNSYREYFPVDEEIVTDEEDSDSWVKNESVNEYNAIEIEMSTYLPVATAYDIASGSFTMSFHDQLDSELVLDEADADFSVAIAGYRIDPAYFSVTLSPDDGCAFHVDVDLTALYNDGVITEDDLEGTTAISVFFFADLEGTGLNGTYASTVWYDLADAGVILYTSEADTVYVYTYEIEILKVDAATGEALSGATLGVYYDSELTNPVSRNGAPYTATSGEDGYAVFYGLAEGTYYIAEVAAPDGYLLSAEVLEVALSENTVDADNIYSATFNNTPIPETIGITVYIVWDDADNEDSLQPASITVQLLANSVVIDEQILSVDNGWSYSWSELDASENGEALSYSVIEPETPDGYSQSDTGLVDNGDGTYSVTITNTHTPDSETSEPNNTIDVTVVKVWDDNNDLYGARPDLIVVVLLQNGQATTLTQLLSAENSWTGTFPDLPEYDENGEKIVYSIAEVTVPNYTSVITGDQDSGFTVTNTYDFDEITNPEPGTPDSGNPNTGTPNSGNPQSGNPDNGVPQTGQDSLPIAPLAVSGAMIVAAGVALLVVRRRRAA